MDFEHLRAPIRSMMNLPSDREMIVKNIIVQHICLIIHDWCSQGRKETLELDQSTLEALDHLLSEINIGA